MAGGGGRTFARVVAHAVEDGYTPVAVGPEPPEELGWARGGDNRLLCCQRAHGAKRWIQIKDCRRTFFDRPVQADEADAARCEHHEAMRNVRGAPRVIGRTHLSGWLFECSWRRLQMVLVLVAT